MLLIRQCPFKVMSKNLPAEVPFESAAMMADAVNYADWTFSLFSPFIRGEVLEVGCGVGTFTKLIVKTPGLSRLLSIDVAAAAVTLCRASIQSPKLELRHSDVRDVRETFDLVVCMNVLEHIEDDLGTLRHLIRMIRPGGTLFLLVPAHQFLYNVFDVESGHFRRYNRRGMRRLIRQASDGEALQLRQFYFNAIGALGYFGVYKLLGRPPRAGGTEIGRFDTYVVPIQRRLEPRILPFGISLISVLARNVENAGEKRGRKTQH
jgi:SAM-dependent methyltransferase